MTSEVEWIRRMIDCQQQPGVVKHESYTFSRTTWQEGVSIFSTERGPMVEHRTSVMFNITHPDYRIAGEWTQM